MAKTYLEQDFEQHIEDYLLSSGYIKRSPVDYDRDLCLIPDEVIAFIRDTQPQEYEKLEMQYGSNTDKKLVSRLSAEISKRGSLDILRRGFKDRGSRFSLAYFKPTSGMNPEHLELYKKNRFSVVRQLRYSKRNENSLDMAIFINGVPVITAELKNSLTGQFVSEAVKQYRNDRDPREPLFAFKRCLVHFAVGNEKVYMTTRLSGHKTRFLPFNRDTENPVNPDGHKTAYLWEDIWQKDTLLDLIDGYLCIQTSTEKYFDKSKGLTEKRSEAMIFPRFHQLDCVRSIINAVGDEGVGHNYLVQHSAGSGKSNSIAWLAHKLASFYQKDSDKDRLFDSIIVLTDRCILDKQLQDTIKQFEKTAGVVCEIDINSAQLQNALEKGKSIIISTIQKFGVIAETINRLGGSRFAVIVDEAHTSQSGESAKQVKQVLSVNLEEAEAKDSDEFDVEDEIIKEIRSRGRQKHISYFAFTATPKNKTLELFGRKDDQGRFVAFHNYWMRQAIEEGFILDVLENYTTYKRCFKLAKSVENDEKYEKKKAFRLLTSYVDLQPHAIETKIRIMLDHFLSHTVNAIQGKGRAMITTRSRLHAVKYYLMLCKVMREKHLPFGALVAFSGTVVDKDSGEEYTEKGLNRLEAKVSIQDAFKTPEFRILVVANKFQTGFDEPLLHTMYVDKKLGGVNAVQTLSRLNRTASGKDSCVVLDFVNEAEDIQDSFQPYYQTTLLSEESDPNKLYDIETELRRYEIFNQSDLDEFAAVFFNPSEPQERLQPILDRAIELWTHRDEQEREDFRSLLQSFSRLYSFISQLVTFEDVDLEKLFVYAKNLNRKLPRRENPLPYDVLDAVDLDSFRIQRTYKGSIGLSEEDGKTVPITSGKPGLTEEEKDFLSAIVEALNETYGMNLTEDDKVDLVRIQEKLEADAELKSVMNPNNSLDNIRIKFNDTVDALVLEFVNTKLGLYKKLTEPKANAMLKAKWFEGYQQQHMNL
ncbi:Type-1 restriction enzyme R protein [Limihaloglobus sulfuriphilus]|uniref:Type-1 restriction enzyme R protein n=1 Tax=Limihaloglobus sulfuriphilus TaxID=1851148 RepID=A0A1Q2MEN9_9BACT|nr:type I restriction endonuclease [Limihaloglobus sulfuriphilus]AQQ71173.1 Type-1 restriction enzyme R protein [Limihaloglobus sulfuriphilus]